MEIVIASVICSIIASIATSLIIARESLNIMRDEADRVFKMNLNFVRDSEQLGNKGNGQHTLDNQPAYIIAR